MEFVVPFSSKHSYCFLCITARVSFILPCGPDGRQQEINADIEKEVSHQVSHNIRY